MAKQVGLKVFRTYTNDDVLQRDWEGDPGNFNGIDAISSSVKGWYASGCANSDMENVFVGCQYGADMKQPGLECSMRPKYEKL